jgi:hypothetical protein
MCSLYCEQVTNRFYTDEIEYPLRKQYWSKQINNDTNEIITLLNSLNLKQGNYQYTSSRNGLLECLIDVSSKAELVNPIKQKVRTAAFTLLNRKHQLPCDRITEYKQIIQSYYYHRTTVNTTTNNDSNNASNVTGSDRTTTAAGVGKNNTDEPPLIATMENDGTQQNAAADDIETPPYLTKEYLEEIKLLKYHDPNPLYRSGVDLVTNSLLSSSIDGDTDEVTATTTTDVMNQRIDNFVKMFRRHFIDTMNPQFLPTGWSIESPTVCDDHI